MMSGPVDMCAPHSPTLVPIMLDVGSADPLQAATLAYWDNILGPRVHNLWLVGDPASERDVMRESEFCLLSTHTLNGEVLRSAPDGAADVKLYELAERGACVSSLVFDAPRWRGRQQQGVLALALVLRLAPRPLCVRAHTLAAARLAHATRVLRVLMYKDSDNIVQFLTGELTSIAKLFVSLNSHGVPDSISLKDTYFEDNPEEEKRNILSSVVRSHLQTCGCSIVIGSDPREVNKMVKTLCLFLSPAERRCSRLADPEAKDKYEYGLVVQGLLKDKDGILTLPFRSVVLAPMPSSLVDVDRPYSVFQTPPKHVHVFRQHKLLRSELVRYWSDPTQLCAPSPIQDINYFQEVPAPDTLVSTFINEVFMVDVGERLQFLARFVLLLQRKALALLFHIEDETQQGKKPLQSLGKVKKELDLTDKGDLSVVMATAEQMRPGVHSFLFGRQVESTLLEQDTLASF
ncbi:guanine nucleotide exchange factor C9orf72 homolog [Petromyzon marinus]|uniref:Guanine nucleotide exchange C9orf72 homolog n=1 Tax=Petromyzon marinus TaxID=7757 RepID=A0AAJ7X554_PETMA|nr:guanine nucleotide exchange C9orf72 homolog [Petromyzon marinus]